MFACVSYERPLPMFLTVTYMLTSSPFWTRPSPLPFLSSTIWYAYWNSGRSSALTVGRISTGGGSAPAAASNLTRTPSARARASIGILQIRFALADFGLVDPAFRPSTSHQPRGAFAVFD